MRMVRSWKVIAASVLVVSTFAGLALADDIQAGKFGADAIFVHPLVASPNGTDSFRADVSITPIQIDTSFAKLEVLPMEAQASVSIGSGQMELARFRAEALRAIFSRAIPVDVLAAYRNLDNGVDFGVDFLGVKVPIKITPGGEIIVQPGLELGVQHVVAPVDQTSFRASFSLEARAATQLVQGWLSTGIMGKVRYNADSGKMSGFEEEGMGYLSLLLDKDHRIYARVYAGIDHSQAREEVGLPTVDVYTGLGIFGNFGK
ncbi:MAG: hypothetical protein HY074_06740 [Deltaproteobacteria bacterium]|nr:hypothetical protein [Deltaproteobacteria bacterium]